MNKSLITNIISLLIVFYGLYSPVYSAEIFMAGLFALSGGITNWLAIHMLFEKVPFLYGSGVITERFKDFKSGIRELILEEFFNKDTVKDFLSKKPIESISENLDDELIFSKIIEAIRESSLGSMVDMLGGEKSLEPIRKPIKNKIVEIIQDLGSSINEEKVDYSSEMISKIEQLIDKRLDELSPNEIKNIIEKIIKNHLGWLVVWGGVFGFLIGSFLGIIGNIN